MCAKLFLHSSLRASVDQSLARLVRQGKLLRVSRGWYTSPRVGIFGERPPSTESLIAAIQKTTGEVLVPTGATSANAMGLTTQVPVREIMLTSGKTRNFQLGKRVIELRHGEAWQVASGTGRAGAAIRAMGWAGPEKASWVIESFEKVLSASDWSEIHNLCPILPAWMSRCILDRVIKS